MGFNSAFKGLISKMDLKEIGYGAGSSTELVQDRVQWQALVFSGVEPSGSATRELVN